MSFPVKGQQQYLVHMTTLIYKLSTAEIHTGISDHHFFFQNPGLVDQYISTLLTLEQSPTTLPLLGVCFDFCSAQKDNATIQKHKVGVFNYLKILMAHSSVFLCLDGVCLPFSECPAGPLCKISPHEQDETTTAHSGQKRLLTASRVSLRVQGDAAPHPAEDDAPQPRERNAEWAFGHGA